MRRVVFSSGVLLLLISASLGNEVTMKIDAPLSKELEVSHSAEQAISVIVVFERSEDLGSLAAMGVKPLNVYESISAISAALTPTQIKDIAAMPQVKSIQLDSEAKALTKP